MITVGLTGGMGSGKSVVASLLETYGIPVYVADTESKRIVSTSPRIRTQITALVGDAVFDANGVLNRHLMASLIFNDAKLLAKINAVIHPAVAYDFMEWVDRQTAQIAVIESAILFESHFRRLVNSCVLVSAPLELRIRRVMARDGITEAEVFQRIQHQIPDRIYRMRANYVIDNDGVEPLIPQVERWINQLTIDN